VPLHPGIDAGHYVAFNSDLDQRSWPPRRWRIARARRIEIWPISDQAARLDTREGYLKFTGIRNLKPLVKDGDGPISTTVLVTLRAAEILAAQRERRTRKLKLDQANRRYAKLRGHLTPASALPDVRRRPALSRARRPTIALPPRLRGA
jgi:hypothetical protein